MEGQSVWLGRLRRPIFFAMLGFMALSAVLYVILVVNHATSSSAPAMYEMIRPGGRTLVQIMLFTLGGALLFASLYLSDFQGAIEPREHNPFDIFSLVLSRAAMILIACIVVTMFYEVVSRYVFSAPTLWANELSLWLAAVVLLLSGQYAMQQRCHIRIPVLYDRMPFWMRKACDTLSVGLIVFFVFALVWGGYNDAEARFMRMETFGTAWDPPLPGTVKPFLLLAMVLVAIQAVANLFADWNKENAFDDPDGVDQTEIDNIRATLGDK